jgi:hypothetical protein
VNLPKFEEKFPTISLVIGGLILLLVAGFVLSILDYIANGLTGMSLAFLLLLAFVAGMSAFAKWLDTKSGRKHYEETWKTRDESFKGPAD